MKSPVALASWMRPRHWLTFGFLVVALPCLGGCAGGLDKGFNSISNGSGGTSGSGGVQGSGGSTSSGGSTGSGGAVGTGGTTTSGSGGGSSVATCDAPTKVFHDSVLGCIDAGCHAAAPGSQTPDLETADPTVLKKYTTTMLCPGSPLVVPSNPKSSVLWEVVDSQTCGELMPKGKANLDQDAEDCLAAWIANL